MKSLVTEVIGINPKVMFISELTDDDNDIAFNSEAGKFFRTTLPEITSECILVSVNLSSGLDELKSFINSTHVELVVLFGKLVYQALLPKEYWEGYSVTTVSHKKPLTINNKRYAVSFHPSFILKNGGNKSTQYDNFIVRLRSLVDKSSNEQFDNLDIEITDLDNLDRVLDFFEGTQNLGFDYESNSLEPFWSGFKILGFSLSSETHAKYVYFNREISKEEIKRLVNFIKSHLLWVFNVNFESQVTWAKFSDEYLYFNDSAILCKINCTPGSLKENARNLLGADFWEDLQSQIRDVFSNIFKVIENLNKLDSKQKLTDGSKLDNTYRILSDALKSGDIETYKNVVNSNKKYSGFSNVLGYVSELNDIISDEELVRGLSKYPDTWDAVPVRLMGEYCCYDSYYTLGIRNKLFPKYDKYYPYYIAQAWLGSIMESYGLNWNDKTASYHDEYYITEAIHCLIEVINRIKHSKIEKTPVLDQNGNQLKDENNKKLFLEREIDCTDEYRLEAKSIYDNKDLSIEEKLEKLKTIFNPMSNLASKQKFFWEKYETDYVKAISMFFLLEENIFGSNIIPDKAYELIDRKDLNKSIKSLLTYDWTQVEGVTENQSNTIKKSVKTLIGSLNKLLKDKIGAFKEDILVWQYTAHEKYGDLDIDNRATWTPEFELLYYLRRFKKVMKSHTTYINGRVGRGEVWLSEIDPDNYTKPPVRLARYYDVMKENDYKTFKLKDNQRWILNTSFNVCSAETKRWKSSVHVVPWGSELREIYESRVDDGLFLHYDYSQSEVRVLAAVSKDEGLIKAFKDGMDIHKFIASKIFRLPPEKITDAERRYSKMCCIRGSNKIMLDDGSLVPISELANKQNVRLYSYDVLTNRIVSGLMLECKPTKRVNNLLRITFDDNGVIEVTPDHKLLCTDGIYRQAQNLHRGNLVLSFPKNSLTVRIENSKDSLNVRNRTLQYVRDLLEFDRFDEYDKYKPISVLPRVELEIYFRCTTEELIQSAWHIPYSGKKLQSVQKQIQTELDEAQLHYLMTSDDSEAIDFRRKNSKKKLELNSKVPESFCKLIVKVENIDINNEIVYDMIVEKYHNYCIATSQNSGVFVSNTFALLYGKTIEGFAAEHMKGDVTAAKKLFNDFYSGFPNVKKWIEEKHNEVKRTGKVSTMFGDPIFIDMSEDPAGGLRKAQNYPIQSSSSSSAGYGIFYNYVLSKSRNLKILPMVFTHDSHDMEFRSQDFFEIIDTVKEAAIDMPLHRFGLPMRIDLEIGANQSDAIEFKEIYRSEDGKTRKFEFSGIERAIKPAFDILAKHFKVTYSVNKIKKNIPSMKELFISRRAFSRYLGIEVDIHSGELELTKLS